MTRTSLVMLYVLAGCWFVANLGQAAVEDLYQADVPVSPDSGQSYEEDLERALAHVLVKVSGRAEVAAFAELARGRATGLVQRYGYRSRRGGELLLWARFDPEGVGKLLQEQGLPRWDRARPTVLLWLVIMGSDGGSDGRSVVGGDEQPEIQNVLLDHAEFRGLPLLLPLWDIEDRSRVRFDDVWEHRLEVLHEASKRYQVQGVLAGRLSQRADRWVGEWTLDSGGEAQRWQTQGMREEALRMAIDRAVAVLAPRSAQVDATIPEDLQLRVMDIMTLEDYARVASYLGRLAAVKQVRARRAEPASVTFAIRLHGGNSDDLRQAIAEGEVLAPEAGAADNLLEYRIRR